MNEFEQNIVECFTPSKVFVLTWAAYLCNERSAAVVSKRQFVCTVAQYFGENPPDSNILNDLKPHFTHRELDPLISASLISLASPNVLVDNMRLVGSYVDAHARADSEVYIAKKSLLGHFFVDSSKIVETLDVCDVRCIWTTAKGELDEFLTTNPEFRSFQLSEMQDTQMLKILRKALPKPQTSGSFKTDVENDNLYMDLTLSETKIHEMCDLNMDLAINVYEDCGQTQKYQYLALLARLYTVQSHIPRAFDALFESFINARRCVEPTSTSFDHDFIWLPSDRALSVAKLVFPLLGMRIAFKSPTLRIPEPLNVPIERIVNFVNKSADQSVYIPHKIEAKLLTLFYLLPSASIEQLQAVWTDLLKHYEHITLSDSNLAIFHFLSANLAMETCSYESACTHLNLCEAEELEVYPVFFENLSLSFPDLDLKWQIILFKYFNLNNCFEALTDLLHASNSTVWSDAMQCTQTLVLADMFIQLQDVRTAEQVLSQLRDDVEYHTFIAQQLHCLKIKLFKARKEYIAAVDLAETYANECRDRCEFNLELKYCLLAVDSMIEQGKAYEAGDWIEDLELVCRERNRPAELLIILLLKTRLCTSLSNLNSRQQLLTQVKRSINCASLRVQCEYYNLLNEPNTELMLKALYFKDCGHKSANMQALLKQYFPGGKHAVSDIEVQQFKTEFKKAYFEHLNSSNEQVHPFLKPRLPFDNMNSLKYKRMRPATGSPRRTHPKKRVIQ